MGLREEIEECNALYGLDKLRKRAINGGEYHLARLAKKRFEERARELKTKLKL